MIIDLPRFIARERPHWTALEKALDRLEEDPERAMDVGAIKSFHSLYQRASADLAKIATFSSEPATLRYLEALVARAYGEIHEARSKGKGPSPSERLLGAFPAAVRRHAAALALAVAVTLLGCAFGGLAVSMDPEAREVIIPFSALHGGPADRVADEESAASDRLEGARTTFSANLMTHNMRVSILALALGMTWGVGTLVLLFYNGAILGAVAVDYALAGQSTFLLGWLLPHGAVEIPAILFAGQAGLVLAAALVGRGDRTALSTRLRAVSGDLVTLMLGAAALLVWAGFVESFLSQYHEPVIPYALKIALGLLEFALLLVVLAGRKTAGGAAGGRP